MVYVLNWSLGGRVVYVFNWSLGGQSGLCSYLEPGWSSGLGF